MKKHRNVFIVNGVIIAIVILWNLIAVMSEKQNQPHNIFGSFSLAGTLILLLGVLNVLSGLLEVSLGSEKGKWLLLNGALILLIGFSVCSIP